MKRNTEERLERKRREFLHRVRLLYPDLDMTILSGKPALAVRVNTINHDGKYGHALAWAPNCYLNDKDRLHLTSLPEFSDGRVYLQNPSSFIPPIVLDPKPGEQILDMCAAPGGKASHVAAITDNKASLWVNDNSKPRYMRMLQNLERLGVEIAGSSLYAVDRISRELPESSFDRILLDAPCSGEGAIDPDNDKSLEYWSVAHIKRLQILQKQALAGAWRLLKQGGILVYSTCTMAPEENEAVIDWGLRKYEDASLLPIPIDLPERVTPIQSWQSRNYETDLELCARIRPSEIMEAFFVAKLLKLPAS